MSIVLLHVHSGNLYGGIETVMVTLAREGADGATHHWALCFRGRLADELERVGTAVHPLGAVRLSRPDSVRAAREALRRAIVEVNPDVIVTHLPWTQAVFGRTLRRTGRPLVQWVHGALEGVVGSLARLTLPDAVICNSAYTLAGLPAAYRARSAEIIFNPVSSAPSCDAATRARTRAVLDTGPADVAIVQASRLEAWKGHREHLRALGKLADVPNWVLWIVGGAQRPREASYLRELEGLSRSLGLAARVRFTGEQEEVSRFLSSADIYCQPNTGPEPFGMTYVEAMQAGLPVVASDAGALPEIVDARTGVLVPPGDVTHLAGALCGLITDAARRRQLASAGPARVHSLCDPRRQAQRVIHFMERLSCRSAA